MLKINFLTFCQKIFTQSSNLFFLAIDFLSHFHSETLFIYVPNTRSVR